jgi:alpha-L-fucosidase
MGWPADGKLTIKSLATGSPNYSGDMGDVHLLGVDEKLACTRDENGLTVTLPDQKPCDHAFVFKIEHGDK